MEKAAWRLILNSITTTALLSLIGVPAMDTVAILGIFGVLLYAQEEVIIAIAGRRGKRDRSIRTAPRRRRGGKAGTGTHRKAV